MSRTTVAVNPTSTSMAVLDVRDVRWAAIGVKNLDESQTLSCWIRRRADSADDFAESNQFEELLSIPPLTQRAVDVDCGVQWELEVVGVASGSGLNAVLTVKFDLGRR